MQTVNLSLSPEVAFDKSLYKNLIAKTLSLPSSDIKGIRLIKRSVDARKPAIKVNLSFEIYFNEETPPKFSIEYKDVHAAKPVLIIGAGPAGLFAALKLIESGIKPVIIERGSAVEQRKYDISALHRKKVLNENSNYCFGEGGAGTYSDGKLFTRSSKRGDVGKILKIFCDHGASEEILFETHAHIGSDKLPSIVASMRNKILDCGGEIFFDKKIIDFNIFNERITEVVDHHGDKYNGTAVILATGHSADDMYLLCRDKKIYCEPKPYAVGFRIEHPQELIDTMQYHSLAMRKYLPAASYSVVEQVKGRGVYSFCMCPGGSVVPASTLNNSLVLNGMSSSRRNLKYANAGFVVSLEAGDFLKYSKEGPLAGLYFRKEIEKLAFEWGGSDFSAPAQKMIDFVNGKLTESQFETSYSIGVKSAELHQLYPEFITNRLKEAFLGLNKKMKGFFTNEALLLAPETRTSSPVRIPRDKENLSHVQIKNLFPCGEGAGYSGGIVSSAIDGERCAASVAAMILGY